MSETALPKTITENGIEYVLDEETQVYLPDWEISEQKNIGKYGLLRLTYLKENRKGMYQAMLMSGKLNGHLAETDEAAHRRLEQIIPQMKEEAGITEELKEQDQMKWVGLMNNIQAAADEIIMNELIYI